MQWVEKCHKLTNELEWLRETARKLTEENKKISRESKRAKRQLRPMRPVSLAACGRSDGREKMNLFNDKSSNI